MNIIFSVKKLYLIAHFVPNWNFSVNNPHVLYT